MDTEIDESEKKQMKSTEFKGLMGVMNPRWYFTRFFHSRTEEAITKVK